MLKRLLARLKSLRSRKFEVCLALSVSLILGVACYGLARDRLMIMRTAHQNAMSLAETLQVQFSGQFQQASHSVVAIRIDLKATSESDGSLKQSIAQAMRYDPVSAFLGLASRGELMMLDRTGNGVDVPDLSVQLERMLPDVRPNSLEFLPLIYSKKKGAWYLPLVLRTDEPGGQHATAFSLIPIRNVISSAPSLHLMSGARFEIMTRAGLRLFSYRAEGGLIDTDAEPFPPTRRKMLEPQGSGTFEDVPARGHVNEIFGYAWSSSQPFAIVTSIPKRSLEVTWLQRSAIPLLLLFFGGLATLVFVVRLRRAAIELAGSHSLYTQLFKSVNDGLVILGRDGVIRHGNEGASRILGAGSAQALAGIDLFALTAADGQEGAMANWGLAWLRDLLPGGTRTDEWRFRRLGQGGTVEVKLQLAAFPEGAEALVTGVLCDVTREREYLRKQEFLARHDALTGLLNRYAFLEHLAMRVQDNGGRPFAVALMDLNRFKEVNDSLGHHAGDAVLEILGARLSRLLHGRSACIARLGGDEIAVCTDPLDWSGGVASLCEHLESTIRQTITVEGVRLEVTAAIGVAMYPDDATTSEQLLRCADIAMYAAKRSMLGYQRYTRHQDQFTPQLLSLKSDFARAIRDGGLTLAYQPKIRLHDEERLGYEALARWTHPVHGLVSPSVFVPLAETTELVHAFTNWVLRTALAQLSAWLQQGFRTSISVNVSANNLLSADFVEEVRAMLHVFNVPPERLELEVTESALMQDPGMGLAHLCALRNLGVRLAIDDFGTGYSSLAYLNRLPVDVLKIDRSFIASMEADTAARRIVEWTIRLAHGLGMLVVAEGVETSEVADLLLSMGCDMAQGYFYGRPANAEQAVQRLNL